MSKAAHGSPHHAPPNSVVDITKSPKGTTLIPDGDILGVLETDAEFSENQSLGRFDRIKLSGRMANVLSTCEEHGLDVVQGDRVAVNTWVPGKW